MRPRAEIQKGTSRIQFETKQDQQQRTLEAILEVLLDLRDGVGFYQESQLPELKRIGKRQ